MSPLNELLSASVKYEVDALLYYRHGLLEVGFCTCVDYDPPAHHIEVMEKKLRDDKGSAFVGAYSTPHSRRVFEYKHRNDTDDDQIRVHFPSAAPRCMLVLMTNPSKISALPEASPFLESVQGIRKP